MVTELLRPFTCGTWRLLLFTWTVWVWFCSIREVLWEERGEAWDGLRKDNRHLCPVSVVLPSSDDVLICATTASRVLWNCFLRLEALEALLCTTGELGRLEGSFGWGLLGERELLRREAESLIGWRAPRSGLALAFSSSLLAAAAIPTTASTLSCCQSYISTTASTLSWVTFQRHCPRSNSDATALPAIIAGHTAANG